MKKRRKLLVPLALVFFLAVAAFVITAFDLTSPKPDYTIFNYKNTGTSLLYDTLGGMGYSILPEYQKIKPNSDIHTIRLVIEPNFYYMSDDDEKNIFEYVRNGGRVIYLTNSSRTAAQSLLILHTATLINQNGEFALLSYGLGQIFLGPPNVTNKELLDSKEAGYYVADVIKSWQVNNIYINEAYHGYNVEPNLWNATPVYMKNSAYQLLLAVLLVVSYLGKRFGRPVPYYEEIEREENEYLIALANVYNKAGNGYIIYETDLERFLKKAAQSFNIYVDPNNINKLPASVLNEWQKRNLPYYDDFLEVMGYREKDFKTKSSGGRSRLYRTRLILDRLEKCL